MSSINDVRDVIANDCLTIVRSSMFADDKAFDENMYLYDGHYASMAFRGDSYFGLDKNDALEVERLIGSVSESTDEASRFPDFLATGVGFIEHFCVTSSYEGAKGSDKMRLDGKMQRDLDNEIAVADKAMSENMNCPPAVFLSTTEKDVSNDYDALMSSFVHHWTHHMDSLYKAKRDNRLTDLPIGAFMIDFRNSVLKMHEDVFAGVENKDVYRATTMNIRMYDGFYSLAHDAELLRFMHYYRHDIKYAIFVGFDMIEIIKLDAVPDILHFLPYPFVYRDCPGIVTRSVIGVKGFAASENAIANDANNTGDENSLGGT